MVALLLAVALIGLVVLALLLAGIVVAGVTGVLVFNALVVVLTLRRRPSRSRDALAEPARDEPWQPASFRRPPTVAAEPRPAAGEKTGPLPTVRIDRL